MASLFCGNLSFSSTQSDLKEHCDSLGIKGINQIELIERNGRSRGWALLHFGNDADSQAAQLKLNDSVLAERALNVRENREDGATPRSQPSYQASPRYQPNANTNTASSSIREFRPESRSEPRRFDDVPETPNNRLFVGNLPWTVTTPQLRDLFSKFNPESAEIQKGLTGRSKGFGTVVFRSETEATAAVSALNNTNVDGRDITVRYDKDSSATQTPSRLFVGNLPWSASDDDLIAMFEGFSVVSANVKTANGRSRGFGLVEFQTLDEAKKAHNAKTEFTFQDRTIFTKFDRQE